MKTRQRIEFIILGKPVGKQRPRVTRNRYTGSSVTYTPKQTVAWERSVKAQAWRYRPEQLLDGPLKAETVFILKRPKSVPKSRQYPAVKPDHDNLEKAVFDALEGVIYTNDSRIVKKIFSKVYGEPERVEVVIEEL